MDLKSFLPHTDKEKEKEYFWSLIIEPGWVQAGVWNIEGEKAEVISISPTTAWETEGELLGAADAALSAAVQNLPDTMADDVAEGLARFSGSEAFPSRIILYNGKEGELEEVKQTLLNVSWESFEKIKFLHSPKVEIVTPERKVLAVSLAGASEIANVTGVGIAKVVGGIEKEEPEEENVVLPEEN